LQNGDVRGSSGLGTRLTKPIRLSDKATHSYSRQLRKEHWKIIEQVRRTHALERTDDNDTLCMDLLASGAILQYLNEKEWYGLNPLLPKRTGS